MRRLAFISLLSLLGLTAIAAPIPIGMRADFAVSAVAPLTWYEGGPSLMQLGAGGLAGLEYDLASWVPARFEFSLFGLRPSAISSGGELYRGWQGFRIAAYSGYRFAPIASVADGRAGLLAGGAITAAGYSDTNLAFAYPSLLA
jgi:hypothetical protein